MCIIKIMKIRLNGPHIDQSDSEYKIISTNVQSSSVHCFRMDILPMFAIQCWQIFRVINPSWLISLWINGWENWESGPIWSDVKNREVSLIFTNTGGRSQLSNRDGRRCSYGSRGWRCKPEGSWAGIEEAEKSTGYAYIWTQETNYSSFHQELKESLHVLFSMIIIFLLATTIVAVKVRRRFGDLRYFGCERFRADFQVDPIKDMTFHNTEITIESSVKWTALLMIFMLRVPMPWQISTFWVTEMTQHFLF